MLCDFQRRRVEEAREKLDCSGEIHTTWFEDSLTLRLFYLTRYETLPPFSRNRIRGRMYICDRQLKTRGTKERAWTWRESRLCTMEGATRRPQRFVQDWTDQGNRSVRSKIDACACAAGFFPPLSATPTRATARRNSDHHHHHHHR